MKILVTGANGFVGLPLSEYLISAGHQVVGAVRSNDALKMANPHIQFKLIGDIDDITDWHDCLGDVECVVHLANRAHVMDEQSSNPLVPDEKMSNH